MRTQESPRRRTGGRDQADEHDNREQPSSGPRRIDGAALAYAARGWAAFPLHSVSRGRCTCGRGDCSSPGKHPRTGNGLHDATTSTEQLGAWWRRWPSSNIGIATGAGSGIFVIDVDVIGTLDELQDRHEQLPETLTQRTGSGGLHLVFTYPEGAKIGNRAGMLEGLDVRGEGGYIVAPPSVHVSGHRYAWLNRRPPAAAPKWLVDLVRSRPVPERPVVPLTRYVGRGGGTPWGEAVLRGEIDNIARAVEGTRNESLFISACATFGAVKGGQLAETDTRHALESAALATGLGAVEVRKTLESAWRRAEARAPEKPVYAEGGVARW